MALDKRIAQLEKKYGIHVERDYGEYDRNGRLIIFYKIYTADGCLWENGLRYNSIFKECKEWSKQLLDIKNGCKHN